MKKTVYKDIEIKPYRIKFSSAEQKKLEKITIQVSTAYRWLREDYKISKNEIRKKLSIQWRDIFISFRDPLNRINLKKLLALQEMMPDKTLAEILTALEPNKERAWYELEDIETDELKRKLGY